MLSRRGTTIGCIIKLGTSRESTRTNIPSRRRFFSGQPSPSSSNPLRPSTPVQVKDKPIGTSIAAAEHAKHTTSQIIEHRPYQQDSLDACLDALSRGVSRIGVSLPTGSGKTVGFSFSEL
ncbi:hypothetical protein PGTUg99_000555 [Puccinia graminis f. sp. tritici]|uniref:Helicase/UvrB N-terminal domain-containing protein n=1 Tax=Puccinia graminis f. sp. tritici TaxID=56615 RepID=A0A5B0P8X9_PUCGR|nr:hypothetical protein PGTUg99_000555 [Puccinia graminis f. sp. tritici]